MKEELYKLIDAVVSQDDEAAKTHFSAYVSAKASVLVAEAKQTDMFGDDKDDDKETKSKFLVKPTGMGYDKKEHAIAAAKNHPDKDMHVVDTESGETVYSHKGTKKSKKKD